MSRTTWRARRTAELGSRRSRALGRAGRSIGARNARYRSDYFAPAASRSMPCGIVENNAGDRRGPDNEARHAAARHTRLHGQAGRLQHQVQQGALRRESREVAASLRIGIAHVAPGPNTSSRGLVQTLCDNASRCCRRTARVSAALLAPARCVLPHLLNAQDAAQRRAGALISRPRPRYRPAVSRW